MRFGELRGVHGLVIEVDDPVRAARQWSRALGLPILRKRAREVVLGGLSLFVVLRRSRGDASGLSEVHVAVESLSARRLDEDSLGGRHSAIDLGESRLRLVIRELTGPPSAAWLPKGGQERPGRRKKRVRTAEADYSETIRLIERTARAAGARSGEDRAAAAGGSMRGTSGRKRVCSVFAPRRPDGGAVRSHQ